MDPGLGFLTHIISKKPMGLGRTLMHSSVVLVYFQSLEGESLSGIFFVSEKPEYQVCSRWNSRTNQLQLLDE